MGNHYGKHIIAKVLELKEKRMYTTRKLVYDSFSKKSQSAQFYVILRYGYLSVFLNIVSFIADEGLFFVQKNDFKKGIMKIMLNK